MVFPWIDRKRGEVCQVLGMCGRPVDISGLVANG